MEALERTIQRLRASERSRDEFIATVAHELRNPLAPIMSSAEVLASASGDPQLSSRACGVIQRQVHLLARLVDDLLDVSRIGCGNLELRTEPAVDLRSVIAAAIESTRPLFDQRGHMIRVRVRRRPLVVAGDAERLGQIVGNLLTNAAKYTDPGGTITVVAACVRGAVAVRVRDTGIGIPTDQLARIFELFAQCGPGRSHSPGGMGVGLALARQLAQRHGGSLVGQSAGPGQGSEFTLALPEACGSGASS